MDKGLEFVTGKINKIFKDAIDNVRGPAVKSREQKATELHDRYAVVLYGMSDEEIDQEYADKIGEV